MTWHKMSDGSATSDVTWQTSVEEMTWWPKPQAFFSSILKSPYVHSEPCTDVCNVAEGL